MEISEFDKIENGAYSVLPGNEWVVLEEAISTLDWSIQQQLEGSCHSKFDNEINLLGSLKKRLERIQESIVELPEMYRHAGNVEDVKGRLSNKCQDIYRVLSDFMLSYRVNKDDVLRDLYESGKKLSSIDEAEEKLVGFYADMAMLDIDSSLQYVDKVDKKISIVRQIDDLRNVLFSYIVTSPKWDSHEAEKVLRLFFSPNVDVVTKQLLASALTLACSNFFDYSKFRILVRVMEESSEMPVRLRALVGLMFGVLDIPSSYESAVATLVREVFEKNPSLMKLFLNACKIELHARNRSEGKEAFGKQLVSAMFNHTKKMMQENSEDEDELDEYGLEDEDEALSNKLLDDVFGLIDKGTDLYYGQFKNKKKDEFFHSVYNWFMPFHTDSVLFLQMMRKLDEGYSEVFYRFLTMSNLCDSDQYSFLTVLLKSDEDVKQVLDEVKKDTRDQESLPEQFGELRYIICYIHSLSRFFDLAPMSNPFFDVFGESMMHHVNLPLASSVFADPYFEKYRLRMARYCLKYDYTPCIPDLLNEDYPDTAECHFMLAKAYIDAVKADDTIDLDSVRALPHADWLMDHDPDNPIFADLAANIYLACQLYPRVVKCWKHLISVAKDEETVTHAKIRLALTYLFDKRYDEAAKLFYELNYKDPENPENLALLAKTLLLKSPGDVSAARKVLSMLDSFEEGRHSDPLDMLLGPSAKSNFEKSDDSFSMFIDHMSAFIKEDHSRDSELSTLTSLCRWVIMGNQKEGEQTYTFEDVWKPIFRVFYYQHVKPFRECTVVTYEPVFEPEYEEWLHSFGIDDNDIALLNEALRNEFNKIESKNKRNKMGGFLDDGKFFLQ